MTDWLNTTLIVGALLAATSAFIYVALKLNSPAKKSKTGEKEFLSAAEQDVEHIFNEDFREELRNRGRLHFEKIISENAMFLQQDLRLTTSQINEHMKGEITKTLQESLARYQESISDAKQVAIDTIGKTQQAVDEQRKILSEQLQKELDQEKIRVMEHFQQNMAEVVNHYVLAAVGNQISLDDQLEFIISELESKKTEIIDDIRAGA